MKIGPKQVPNAISQLLEGATQKKYTQDYLHFPENHFLENKNSPGLFLMSDLTIENYEVVVLSDIFHAKVWRNTSATGLTISLKLSLNELWMRIKLFTVRKKKRPQHFFFMSDLTIEFFGIRVKSDIFEISGSGDHRGDVQD